MSKRRKGPYKCSIEIGKSYNRWTVIEWRGSKALCKCSCGNLKLVRPSCVKTGASKSCGCLTKELNTIRNTKLVSENFARIRGTLAYFKSNTWGNLNKRTVNGANVTEKGKIKFKSYFDKGIKLLMDKDTFYKWCDSQKEIITKMYEDNKTPSIDRINNKGHYQLNNIQILTHRENIKKANKVINGQVVEL